jgi:hypothetical protein
MTVHVINGEKVDIRQACKNLNSALSSNAGLFADEEAIEEDTEMDAE